MTGIESYNHAKNPGYLQRSWRPQYYVHKPRGSQEYRVLWEGLPTSRALWAQGRSSVLKQDGRQQIGVKGSLGNLEGPGGWQGASVFLG